MINHKQILSKLSSYKNLHELTKAIQLVAMSKLSSLKKKQLNRSLVPAYTLLKIDSKDINDEPITFIPVTTDKSCCGSINNNVIDLIKQYIKNLFNPLDVFLLGKKGLSFCNKVCPNELIYNLTEITKYNISIITVTVILEKVYENINVKASSYIFIYNYFKNIVTQQLAYLSLQSRENFLNNLDCNLNNFTFLNNTFKKKHRYFHEDLYNYLASIVVMKILYENEMSEYGARASSMRNASKNAEELINKLQLQYNKARQAHITNELIEILSCVNSIMTGNNLDKYSFYLQFVHQSPC
mgnify:CR=1 FL=1